MTHVYWNKIMTKDDLALMLWEFHNTVNKRLGVAQMPYEDCVARYNRANTPVVFAAFANISSQSSVGVVSTMVSKIRRRGVAQRAWDYLAAHKDDFAH